MVFSEGNRGLQIQDLLQEKTESCISEGDRMEIHGSGGMWTGIVCKTSWFFYFPEAPSALLSNAPLTQALCGTERFSQCFHLSD